MLKTLRVATAIVIAAIHFVAFYYVPVNLASLVARVAPPQVAEAVSWLTPQIIPRTLPLIGLIVTVLTPAVILLKNTKAYGPLTTLTGLAFTAYVYTALQGGFITITVPKIPPIGLEATITMAATALMYLFLLPPTLTIVKGILITVEAVSRVKALKGSLKPSTTPANTKANSYSNRLIRNES